MSAPMSFSFTTGPSKMPDVGVLSYNGCTFSPLYETHLSGNAVADAAGRTVKEVEYTLEADGYVTLTTGQPDISGTMELLATLLQAQGGALVYKGRGFDFSVNTAGSFLGLGSRDVAWGPVPKLLDFQPLGGGLSAKVKWQVTFRVPEGSVPPSGLGLLQFNYETSVSYGEDGYSHLSVNGTLEIPLTRRAQIIRAVTTTADARRDYLTRTVFRGIDLSRFHKIRRDFKLSRDKRTLEFSLTADEKPYMDNPPYCTIARGTYSVRPARAGAGLVAWLCNLKATYIVRADFGRGTAWRNFQNLMRLRIDSTIVATVEIPGAPVINVRRSWLTDFNVDEGIYEDSKTVTFSVTWRLTTTFQNILTHSKLWRKLPETAPGTTNNLWATSVRDIMGPYSWLRNVVDPSLDLIVDMGV